VHDQQQHRDRHHAEHGRAVALRLDADALECRERAFEVRALARLAEVDGAAVAVGVVPDLVAGGGDPLDGLGIAVGGEAGHEERGLDRDVVEQPQQPGNTDQRAVRLVGHDHRVVGVATALGEDGGLGVDVEGQHRERRALTQPGHPDLQANHLERRISTSESISNSAFAANSAVTCPAASYVGATSTTSKPINRTPLSARR
jgi:hypothetical protein